MTQPESAKTKLAMLRATGTSGSNGPGSRSIHSSRFQLEADNKRLEELQQRIESKKLASAAFDKSRDLMDGTNSSPDKPYSPTRYVPLSERTGNVADSGRLTGKRDVRDNFFKGDPMSTKYDPSSREREKEKEKSSYSSSQGLPTIGQSAKEVDGYVGFANLPNQVYRKSVKRGFEFTLMVVGESGLGKSTLINSMFLADLYSAEYPGPSHRIKKTVQVETSQVVLKEGGVQLRLTVVDTPGFGDAVDNSNCWQPIIDHIESKYDEYLNAESRVNRKSNADNRVHCCLYFISPNGHGLKPLDVEFMKRLHDKVNIIPLIAKADTLTPDECREFKKTILNEIAQHKIKIYEFPDCDDEEENKLQKKLKVRDRVPFAVVGSNTVVDSQGRKVRGRVYPWGVVEVENLEHNDFIALRNMLIRTHMQDLKDVTNNVHYENFRYNKLAAVTANSKTKPGGTSNPETPVPSVRRKKLERALSMQGQATIISDAPDSSVREKWRSSSSDIASASLTNGIPPASPHSPLALAVQKNQASPGSEAPKGFRARVGLILGLTSRVKNPLAQMEEEKKDHVQKMKKMEAEMEQVFEMKVREKKQKLKDSESDLQKRAEQMKKSLEQQAKELDEARKRFEKERISWEETQEEQRRRSLENAKETMKKDKKKSLF